MTYAANDEYRGKGGGQRPRGGQRPVMLNRWQAKRGIVGKLLGDTCGGERGRVGDRGRGVHKEGYEAVGVVTQRPRMGGRLRARQMRVCIIP